MENWQMLWNWYTIDACKMLSSPSSQSTLQLDTN
jgi:hypothetical protein